MIRYFYQLSFSYEVEKDREGNPVFSSFDLGYLSTKAKVMAKIEEYKNLPGFKDHPIDCFIIDKFGVSFDKDIKDKSSVVLYELWHEYEDEDGYERPSSWVGFKTKKEATEYMNRLKKRGIYKKYPNDFNIARIKIDADVMGWEEGFKSFDAD